jgi:hypothetical protein
MAESTLVASPYMNVIITPKWWCHLGLMCCWAAVCMGANPHRVAHIAARWLFTYEIVK